MTDFRPKGHITLTAALERAGPIVVKGWVGDDISPEIWITDNDPKFWEERQSFIASCVSEVALTEWGDRWMYAVKRWFDAKTDAEKHALVAANQGEIDALAEQLGDIQKAWCAIGLREGARAVLRQAEIHHDLPLGASWFGNGPASAPMIELDGALEAVEVDRQTLIGYQRDADAHFKPINQSRLAAQARWRDAVVWFRREFHAGTLACSYVARDGSQATLEPLIFGTDDCEGLFRSGQLEGRELLVAEAEFEAALAKSKGTWVVAEREQSMQPQPVRPDPADFDPMRLLRWTTPMAAAWIGTRDINAVREQWNDWREKFCFPRKDWDGGWYEAKRRPASLLRVSHPNPADPEGDWLLTWFTFRQALKDGHVVAAGTDIQTGIPVEIPAIHWQRLDDFPDFPDVEPNFRFPHSQPEAGYDDVTVRRDDVMRTWPAVPSQIVEPDPADFDPMQEAHWTLPMVVAWIFWRTADATREQWNKWLESYYVPRAHPEISETRRRASLTVIFTQWPETLTTWRELQRRLEDGTVKARGFSVGEGRRVAIDPDEWRYLKDHTTGEDFEPLFVHGRNPAIRYDDVTVESVRVLKIWRSSGPIAKAARPTSPPKRSFSKPAVAKAYRAAFEFA